MSLHIGNIKWFGGYNSKTDTYNNYGFIAVADGEDVFFHRDSLQDSREYFDSDSIFEGLDVVFETEIRNGKTAASKVYPVLMKCKNFISSNTVDDLNMLHDILSLCSPLLQYRIVEQMPIDMRQNPKFIPFLRDIDRELVRLLSELRSSGVAMDDTVDKVGAVLLNNPQLSVYLTNEEKRDMRLISFLPTEHQLEALIWHIEKSQLMHKESAIIDYLAKILETHSEFMNRVPRSYFYNPVLVNLLPDTQQVELIWTLTSDGVSKLWQKLTVNARIYAVYRAAKENRNLFIEWDFVTSEQHPLVQLTLNALWAKFNEVPKHQVFQRIHQLFQDYVVLQAWASTSPLDLTPILPNCVPNTVVHCEGRIWFTDEEKASKTPRTSRAFCPRLKRPCYVYSSTSMDEYNDASDIPF